MTAIVLVESPLTIVKRESLAQFIVLKIALQDLRFHPMTDLLAFLPPMWHVHHFLWMLIVLDLLKREFLNNQSLLSKIVSASLALQEWKTVSPTNRAWRSAYQMHLLPLLMPVLAL